MLETSWNPLKDPIGIPNFNHFCFFLPCVSRHEAETDLDSGFETSDCSQSQLNNYLSVAQCGALSHSEGPFAACHAALEPQIYQE